MTVAEVLFAAGLVVGLVLVGAVGVVALRHRQTPGGLPLAVLAAGVAVWMVAMLVMVASRSFETTMLAERAMYVGIVTTVPAFFAFALDYSGRGDLLGRRVVALLAVEPALVLAAIATNPSHELFWTSIRPADTLSGLATTHGPLFWVHVAYSYLLLLVASGLLVRLVVGETAVYRQQATALLVAVVVPWAVNAAYVFEVVAVDLTPLGFAVSGAALGWAMVRADFVQLAPVGREAVVETMGSGVFVVDRGGRLADVNPTGREMLAEDGESVVGRDLSALLAERPELPDSFAAMEDGPTEIQVDGLGGARYFEIEVSRLHDARDRFLGHLVVASEVTRRREREQELRRKNERLDQFAGVVSHDLRNPLTVATSYIDLAMESGEEEHLRRARSATERMETIIDDVLSLAREGDDVDPDGEVDVAAVAREAWESVDTGDATLVVEDPPTVTADHARLLRALENLFRNAVEHGTDRPDGEDAAAPGGGTREPEDAAGHDGEDLTLEGGSEHGSSGQRADGDCRADGDGRPDDGTGLTVTVGSIADGDGFYVADDGAGIPPDRREAVLEPGESSSGGTGLGLAIVDTIVEGHGWGLVVDESATGGARFEVRSVGR